MLDDAGVKILLEKKLPYVPTVDDLVALDEPDLRETGGRNSRLRLLEQAFRKAVAAGIPIVFGSGATSPAIPHGKQANQFAYYAKWGLTPAQALQTAYLPAARMLNYDWENHIGSIEKGKFADIIAVSGNPLNDLSEMERVKFVMKGGAVDAQRSDGDDHELIRSLQRVIPGAACGEPGIQRAFRYESAWIPVRAQVRSPE